MVHSFTCITGPPAVGGLVVRVRKSTPLIVLELILIQVMLIPAQVLANLPSWVLKMRLKIANSRMEHANVESALFNLNQYSMDLDKICFCYDQSIIIEGKYQVMRLKMADITKAIPHLMLALSSLLL